MAKTSHNVVVEITPEITQTMQVNSVFNDLVISWPDTKKLIWTCENKVWQSLSLFQQTFPWHVFSDNSKNHGSNLLKIVLLYMKLQKRTKKMAQIKKNLDKSVYLLKVKSISEVINVVAGMNGWFDFLLAMVFWYQNTKYCQWNH